MTPKFVSGLAVAAAVSVAGAYLAYQANNIFVPQVGTGEKVLPAFNDQVNNVTEIVVEQGKDKLELANRGGFWQVKQSGYPVSSGKIKKSLLDLADLTKLEAKTANSKKYLLINVDGPGKSDGRGRQFTIKGKDGKELAQIVLGKTATGKAGPGRDAQYVRLANEKTSWLVLGAVNGSAALPSWVEPRFLKLDVDSVIYGRVEYDGRKIEVRRTGKSESGSSQFELLDIPEGRKPRTSTTIKFTATDLVNLDLIDVRPLREDRKATSQAFIELDGGLKLSFKMVEEHDKGWVSVKVVEKGSKIKLAEAIASATKGWEFLVSDTKRQAFKKRKEDLLEKPE